VDELLKKLDFKVFLFQTMFDTPDCANPGSMRQRQPLCSAERSQTPRFPQSIDAVEVIH